MSKSIYLVQCSKPKRKNPSQAQDLYTSDLFKKSSAYAKIHSDEWFILSALHHLVRPDQVLDYYDVTLKGKSKLLRIDWAIQVFSALQIQISPDDRIVFLTGKLYSEFLLPMLVDHGWNVENPMEGLPIGKETAMAQEPPGGQKMSRLDDLQRFYQILARLDTKLGGTRTLEGANGHMDWPCRGVYFFFEPGELRTSSGNGLRIVRVGTHALKENSKTSLWDRLRQHRGSMNNGGGNHRGSIFRLHVGTALLNKEERDNEIKSSWGKGSNAPADVRHMELPLEQEVSRHIRKMPFLWLDVDDEPGPDSQRGYIERNAIALLSNFNFEEQPLDPPSKSWLGNWADRENIRKSGLWNVNHVTESYEPGLLDILEKSILIG